MLVTLPSPRPGTSTHPLLPKCCELGSVPNSLPFHYFHLRFTFEFIKEVRSALIHDTCYYAIGGDSDHRSLRLRLSIDCNFVEPQHMVVTKKFLPRFKYDKSKLEKYQLALTTSLGNSWVIDLIGHLRVDELVDLL